MILLGINGIDVGYTRPTLGDADPDITSGLTIIAVLAAIGIGLSIITYKPKRRR